MALRSRDHDYVNLVAWIGCHADSHQISETFGDDIEFRRDYYARDRSEPGWGFALASRAGRGRPILERPGRMGSFLLTGSASMSELITQGAAGIPNATATVM